MTALRRTSPGRPVRRAATALALCLGVLALVLGSPSAALAHDGLVSTSPASGSTVDLAPDSVTLEFTGEPLPLGTLVVVIGPDGDSVSSGAAEIRGTTVVQAIAPDAAAGTYRVEWRSSSSDGHALSGVFDFTVTGTAVPSDAAAGAPSPAADARPADDAAAADAAAAATTEADGIPAVWLAAGAILLGGLVVLLVTRLRHRG